MGERGPLPLPYARRRNRRPNGGKVALVASPEMPDELPAEAQAEWQRVVPELEQMGTITTVDRAVLVRYCTAWSDWVEVERMLEKSGKLIKGQKGNFVRNPLLMVRSDIEATLSDLGKQLGLSPGARLRQGITHEQPADDAEAAARRVTVIDDYKRRLGLLPEGTDED
jgi:P27 family predicted phage terminase small subunit